MTQPRVFEISFPSDQNPLGIKPSTPHARVPFWKDARNITWHNGVPEKVKGFKSVTSGSSVFTSGLGSKGSITGGIDMFNSATAMLIIGTPGGIFTWQENGGSVGNIFGFGSGVDLDDTSNTVATVWAMVPWRGGFLAAYSKEAPIVWQGTAGATEAVNVVFSPHYSCVETICPYGNDYILASCGPQRYGPKTRIAWNNAGDENQWSPTVANTAGFIQVKEVNKFNALAKLGDRVAAYSDAGMYIVTYVGPPYYFTVNMALPGISAINKRSVVTVGRLNYVFSRNGIFETDGTQYQDIGKPDIWQYLEDNCDFSAPKFIHAYHDSRRAMVMFVFRDAFAAARTDVLKAIGFDYERRAWSIYTNPYCTSLWVDANVFPDPVGVRAYTVGTAPIDMGFRIRKYHQGRDADTSALTSFIQSSIFPMGESNLMKEVTESFVEGAISPSLTMKLTMHKWQSNDTGTVSYAAKSLVQDGADLKWRAGGGRYARLKFITTATGQSFMITGFYLRGRQGGDR